jgi:hypothetical protein
MRMVACLLVAWLLIVGLTQGRTVVKHPASRSLVGVAAARQQPQPLEWFPADNESVLLLRRWRRPRMYSIVFNKIAKCSSSSAGGVMRALAYNMGLFTDTQILGLTNNTAQRVDRAAVTGATLDGIITHQPFIMATHAAAHIWQVLQRVRVRVPARVRFRSPCV